MKLAVVMLSVHISIMFLTIFRSHFLSVIEVQVKKVFVDIFFNHLFWYLFLCREREVWAGS